VISQEAQIKIVLSDKKQKTKPKISTALEEPIPQFADPDSGMYVGLTEKLSQLA
jgi:hypothetical protein